MKKLSRKQWPDDHSENDFKCFGPPAINDGEFEGTMICDMGCFKQDGTDSNKFYHGAVVQSKKTGDWYAYFTWGRTGAPSPDFQFFHCFSKEEAESKYVKQLHSKNDKRGEWFNHATLGKILRAKPNKDCYLVRPQATRSTGLPDARTIAKNDVKPNGKKKSSKKIKAVSVDSHTMKLIRDLNIGTISYTRASMADQAIPTQAAINEGRDILSEAKYRVRSLGDDVEAQVSDKELINLTSMIYSRIPKKKGRKTKAAEWILSIDNISRWESDLDAFEAALHASDFGSEIEENPFGDMPIRRLEWLPPSSDTGKFLYRWLPKATRNKHGNVRPIKIRNMWLLEREGDINRISKAQSIVAKDNPRTRHKPLFQPERIDLDKEELKRSISSNTRLLFHGTRSVNVSGILRKSLQLPKKLVGVVITGALAGPGIYFADDWKKSAGYCSLRNSYWAGGGGAIKGRDAFMFVADVVLGKPYLLNGPKGFTSPPRGHHSVFMKGGGYVMNNEFIVYRANQCRLRYLIEFAA